MLPPMPGSDQLIILNVGGREFWTKVSNLRKLPRLFENDSLQCSKCANLPMKVTPGKNCVRLIDGGDPKIL